MGRIRSLLEPIAKRRERESKTFDTTHPLAQAIIKGWKTGSKTGSPVDCLVISPQFELMGKQPANELLKDSERRGLPRDAYYLTFLKEALAGKQPGLGNITLTNEHPSHEVLDTFRTPTGDYQNYTVVVIDARYFEKGGTLTIHIEVGRGNSDGLLYLLDGDKEFSTKEKVPKDTLAWAWIGPNDTGQIIHRFDQGRFFKLGATGHRDEQKTCVNAFHAKISVEGR